MAPTKILSESLQIIKEQGPSEFIRRVFGFCYRKSLRKFLPQSGYYTENKVKIKEKKSFDRFFYLPDSFSNYPNREGGIVSSHIGLTRKGDSVVIVGGGRGITAIRANKIVGETGNVSIYEGGKESITDIKNTIEINNIESDIDIHHAIVGKERDVYWGDSTEADLLSPDDLPKCSVLELDCEGSEIDILKSLGIRPRVIILELHPYNYEEDPEMPLKILSEYGYDIALRFGHDGTPIYDDELSEILLNRYQWGEKVLQSGAQPPAVIAAIRKDTFYL